MPKGGKYDRCIKHVEGKVANPYAVCHHVKGGKKGKKGKKK